MDGTAQTRLEEAWQQTFDLLPDLIMILDDQQRVVRVNRALAEKVGRPPQELLGQLCYQLIHAADSPPFFCPHSQMLRDNRQCMAEVAEERLQGVFQVSVIPVHHDDGSLAGSVHVARDIGRQGHSPQAADEALRNRDQFLAMLSHELRNPLGAILNAVQVAQRVSPAQPQLAEILGLIERQARQMGGLLNDLLDVSRYVFQKIEIRCQRVDLVAIAQEAVKVVRPQIDRGKYTFDLDLRDGALIVMGDPVRLQQILVNLLHNAVKYTPPGGCIRLSLGREGSQSVLAVRDTGVGISPDMLEKVFDPFVQADAARNPQEGGFGIGLTLVRMLVDLHGGTVTASSDGLGRGSQFLVRLPLAADSPQPTDGQSPPRPSPPALKVLIVEDDADSREILRLLLELEGHDVRVAGNGAAALDQIDREAVDAAVIDIGLPGMDGYELARRIRARPPHRCPRLLALTGYGQPSDQAAVKEAGFDKHLLKPCDPAELSRTLAEPW
jgi:PAS domain S-box-containing protein